MTKLVINFKFCKLSVIFGTVLSEKSSNNEEYSEILSLHVNKTSVNNLFIKDVLLSENIGLYFEVFGVITGVLSDSYFYVEDYSGSILVHYDTDSFDPVAQKGNKVSLIGKLSHDGNNFSLTEVKLVNLVSKDNFVRTNQVEINDLSKYLYKKVSINDMKVISIETNKDTIIPLYKDGIYVDLVIDDILDENIYNAILALKETLNVNDIVHLNGVYVNYYNGKISLQINDVYSLIKINKQETLGYGKRYTYGIDKNIYTVSTIKEFDEAFLNSYFNNYDGLEVKFNCINNPITLDDIQSKTHVFDLIDNYDYSYIPDGEEGIFTTEQVTFTFHDFHEDTASLYAEQTKYNIYEELANASLILKEDYLNRSEHKRLDDFEDFPIYLKNKGSLNVRNSQELWIALEKGYVPNFVINNSAAESYFIQAKNILRNIITNDMSDVEKVKSIYDYICYNSTYDFDALNVNNRLLYGCQYIDGFFKEGRLVCDGLAKTFSMFCAIEGIQSYHMSGWNDESGHAWNYVNIDGYWFLVCTTYGQLNAKPATEIGKLYNYSRVEWISYVPFLTYVSYMDEEYCYQYEYEEIRANYNKYLYNPLCYESSYDYEISSQEELNKLFLTIKDHNISGKYYITVNTYMYELDLDNVNLALENANIDCNFILYYEHVYETNYYTIFVNEIIKKE